MALRQLDSVSDALGWLAQRGVRALSCDSRRLVRGDAFIAWPGFAVDGRQFVPVALKSGAAACLVEAEGAQSFKFLHEAEEVAAMKGLKASAGVLASGFMGEPSRSLDVVAVTGTNGKTSIAWWVAQALASLGRRCGVIGTLGIGEPATTNLPDTMRATGMTTPDPVTVQAGLKGFVDSGLRACAIEATSIGIAEHRLDGTKIDVALFTNFTHDHLDYHGSMTAYWAAKARLFAWPGLRAAVVNVDDAQGAALARSLPDEALDVWTYSAAAPARLHASSICHADQGLSFHLHEGPMELGIDTQLIGTFNVSNLLCVIGALRALGVPLAQAAIACGRLTPVPGRMQRVVSGPHSPRVVIDYAHTPDALEKALLALQPLAARRGGALWCVFGCGGNRDAAKRPLMGALAERLAQQVVITSDNPRDELPGTILQQISAGLAGPERVRVIEDRRLAIECAVGDSDPRDVILIAGKGHEDYQDIAGHKYPFSDLEEASAALAKREAGAQ